MLTLRSRYHWTHRRSGLKPSLCERQYVSWQARNFRNVLKRWKELLLMFPMSLSQWVIYS